MIDTCLSSLSNKVLGVRVLRRMFLVVLVKFSGEVRQMAGWLGCLGGHVF